jgi:indolepyruvate ferredoxin oxidoreductase
VTVDANIAAFRIGRTACAERSTIEGVSAVADDATHAHASRDLEQLIRHRHADLVEYQNHRYARRFTETVARVRAREQSVCATDTLTEQVVNGLYKLMAYKDEYEVARLSLRPELTESLVAEFGPGVTYSYRLHPPLLRALGMRRKISLGPWFRPAFRTLLILRRLRGTPFDPFGRAEVRRIERALVTEYLATIDTLLDNLTPQNASLAARIAALPELVRGYEDIKLRNVADYRDKIAAGLRDFQPPNSASGAEVSASSSR